MNHSLKILLTAMLAVTIALLAGLGYQYIYSKSEYQIEKLEPTTVTEEITLPVVRYLELLPQSGPPQIDEQVVAEMVSLLSSQAQSSLLVPHSRGLAMFAGVQDLPDQGSKINQVDQFTPSQAEVSTVWNYSGAPVEKIFVLVLEADGWKIDQIR